MIKFYACTIIVIIKCLQNMKLIYIYSVYLFLLHIFQNQNAHKSKAAKYLSTKNIFQ
jgi:hypothetical protein